MGAQELEGFSIEARTKREIDDRGNVTLDRLLLESKGEVGIKERILESESEVEEGSSNGATNTEEGLGNNRRRRLRKKSHDFGIRRNRHNRFL